MASDIFVSGRHREAGAFLDIDTPAICSFPTCQVCQPELLQHQISVLTKLF